MRIYFLYVHRDDFFNLKYSVSILLHCMSKKLIKKAAEKLQFLLNWLFLRQYLNLFAK